MFPNTGHYLSRLTTQQLIEAKCYICIEEHLGGCQCHGFVKVSEIIRCDGHIKLVDSFRICSPKAMYKSTNAKRMLLQMPLATLSVGKSGSHQVYLVDEGENLTLARQALESYHHKSTCPLTPDTLKTILKHAESYQERERVRYVVIKSFD